MFPQGCGDPAGSARGSREAFFSWAGLQTPPAALTRPKAQSGRQSGVHLVFKGKRVEKTQKRAGNGEMRCWAFLPGNLSELRPIKFCTELVPNSMGSSGFAATGDLKE